ncbi:hypothetical protein Mapa_002755 [Marchantia paleacea]|nr:hypothetical protein Mapa_002755 [Marchantia paleacea]
MLSSTSVSAVVPQSPRWLKSTIGGSLLRTCARTRTQTSTCDVNSGQAEWSGKLDVEKLLNRPWLMPQPSTQITKISIEDFSEATVNPRLEPPSWRRTLHGLWEEIRYANAQSAQPEHRDDNPAFYIIRDDLLHPLLGGNKLRKLDALIPELERMGATDVVTCGGCQSAHTAALAFACTERGMSAHLLLRGERPATPTGYNLLCGMYGHVTYIPRSEYADRVGMLSKYASQISGSRGSVTWLDGECDPNPPAAAEFQGLRERKTESRKKNVVVVKEGAGDAIALLGLIRLVQFLSNPAALGRDDPVHLVVDTGTGTTAVGVALAIALLGLPWEVTGVILADSVENYEKHQLRLISDFSTKFCSSPTEGLLLPLKWEHRFNPRKFGKVFPGEIETCRSIARQTGILLDPIYTLAGWESAVKFSVECKGSNRVVMLHTGGTLGLFGLAQRFPAEF